MLRNSPVIGGIAVPEVEIKLAYFKGLDNVNLFYGAGTMKRDQVMGKETIPSESSHLLVLGKRQPNALSPLITR